MIIKIHLNTFKIKIYLKELFISYTIVPHSTGILKTVTFLIECDQALSGQTVYVSHTAVHQSAHQTQTSSSHSSSIAISASGSSSSNSSHSSHHYNCYHNHRYYRGNLYLIQFAYSYKSYSGKRWKSWKKVTYQYLLKLSHIEIFQKFLEKQKGSIVIEHIQVKLLV